MQFKTNRLRAVVSLVLIYLFLLGNIAGAQDPNITARCNETQTFKGVIVQLYQEGTDGVSRPIDVCVPNEEPVCPSGLSLRGSEHRITINDKLERDKTLKLSSFRLTCEIDFCCFEVLSAVKDSPNMVSPWN